MLRTDSQAEILLSFHGIGHEYRGLLVASLTFFRRTQTEAGDREIADVAPVSTEVLQINYRQNPVAMRARFERWLEEGLARELEIWRAGL